MERHLAAREKEKERERERAGATTGAGGSDVSDAKVS